MPQRSVITEPEPDDPEDRAAAVSAAEARKARQLAMLQELAEIGMQMARAVRDEALAEAVEPDTPRPPSRFGRANLGLVYSRIARAVRQTLALETRLAEEIEQARGERAQRRLDDLRWTAHERECEIRDYVAEAIEAEAVEKKSSEREVERLLDDLDERIEAGDYDDTLVSAPIGELVARICEDLGVIPDWDLWDQHEWADEHLRAQALSDIGAERWSFPQTRPAPRPTEAHDPPDTG